MTTEEIKVGDLAAIFLHLGCGDSLYYVNNEDKRAELSQKGKTFYITEAGTKIEFKPTMTFFQAKKFSKSTPHKNITFVEAVKVMEDGEKVRAYSLKNPQDVSEVWTYKNMVSESRVGGHGARVTTLSFQRLLDLKWSRAI